LSQQINLFNPVFLKQKKYFSFAAMLQAILLLVIGCALLTGYAKYRVINLRKEAAASQVQMSIFDAQLAKAKIDFAPRGKSPALEAEIHKAEAEMKSLDKVFGVLQSGDFGNTKGYSGYLAAFARQIVDGIWLTGFNLAGAGNEISIQGRAVRPELVPVYMSRLKNEPLMQGKSFGALDIQTPTASAVGVKSAGPAVQYVDFNLR
jgi:Tfp pilus assembly protein PilN